MDIKVELGPKSKNFVAKFNLLKEKYGEEFAKINGLSSVQLSLSEFIDNFIDKETVADASIDGNANVGHKDIVTLLHEMNKPKQKLLAYNKIFYELTKEYGLKIAEEWFEAEWNGHLYLHDANTSTFVPYSYNGGELLVVYYKNRKLLVTFAELFDLVEEPIELLCKEDNAYCKYTNDLYVEDIVENNIVKTKVIRVIRKPKTNDFHFIKTSNGFTLIVTNNHPVITTKGDILAENITNNYDLITTSSVTLDGNINTIYAAEYLYPIAKKENFELILGGHLVDDETDLKLDKFIYIKYPRVRSRPIKNKILLTKELGYIIGLAVSDGNYYKKDIKSPVLTISQNPGEILNRLIDCLEKSSIPYTCNKTRIVVGNTTFCKFILNSILKNAKSNNKLLNSNIINFNKEFLNGLLGGFVDGDGTIGKSRNTFNFFSNSRGLINQLIYLFRGFNYKPRLNNTNIKGNWFRCHTKAYSNCEKLYSIKLEKLDYTVLFENSFKFANKRYSYKDTDAHVYTNIKLTENTDTYVYDISTETTHFISNGILSHNCFAYDLKRLAEEGLFFLERHNNKPPKHLITFIDFVKEFINFVSNRTSGACGLPNLIPYMYYFWSRDVKNGYYTVSPEAYAKQNIQRFIYAVNQPYTRDGIQSAFTNTSIFDRNYLEAIFGGAEFPDGAFMVDELDEIMEFQKLFLEEMSDIRAVNMMTFPVNTISLLKKDGKFLDEDFARYASKHNMKWMDSNLFCDTSVTSLSNCCRLKNSIKDLGFFNSIGGSALKVGSVKVSTINLARIALDSKNEDEYIENLKYYLDLDLKVLHIIRKIIKRNVEKGLLNNFGDGLLDFEHLYNTVGFIGIYETMKKFGYTYIDELGNTFYTKKASNLGKKLFETINTAKAEFAKDKDYMINTEQVPGESCADKLMKKDALIYPNDYINDLPLYGNQFLPLGVQATLTERSRIAALFDNYCTGGSILHVNVEGQFTNEEQAWEMLNYITDQGVTYFAFNAKIQACKHNHAFFGKKCPICGEPVDTEYTRIVGFYTPIKTWSKSRKEEYKLRKWENVSN